MQAAQILRSTAYQVARSLAIMLGKKSRCPKGAELLRPGRARSV
jgi:hypothetical protein